MKSNRLLPIAVTVVSALTILLLVSNRLSGLTFLRRITQPRPNLQRCTSKILFTAPRHGSTWLVDSLEHCRFRNNGTYGRTNFYAETWNSGSLRENSHKQPEDVIRYVQENSTVKIFPTSFNTYPGYVDQLVRLAGEQHVGAVILTRKAKDALVSWNKAMESNFWNAIPSSEKRAERDEDVDEEEVEVLEKNLLRYFDRVRGILRESKVRVDELDYDDIVGREFIVLSNLECYVHNCDYLSEGLEQ